MAIRAACEARDKADYDDESPICIYDMCKRLDVPVRFVPINMEGMFRRQPTPQIMVSAFRPLPRQIFTCAHELGHFWMGHGSTIDELKSSAEQYDGRPPEEIVADAFGAAVLMPTIGLRYALAIRGVGGTDLAPETVYTIACDFGVGYDTLINHLLWGVREIGEAKAKQLRRSPPQVMRKTIIGDAGKQHMLMVDAECKAKTMDTMVGSHVVTPRGSISNEKCLTFVERRDDYDIFQVIRQGTSELQISGRSHPIHIRGTKPNHPDEANDAEYYVGLAHYRHLEEEDDDV
jgi:Zn-dependent peptidase ImmA (M78 family)